MDGKGSTGSAASRALPDVSPMPPRVGGPIPWLGAGARLLRDPTAFFATQRRRHGDTFVVDALGYRFFCVFSPSGVRALYGFAEREASFGLATFNLIRHKVPDELLIGRRNTPHSLFGREEVEGYLDNLEQAVALEIARLGESGTFEVFATMRRLGHRLGLSSWAGPEAASDGFLDRLIPLLDTLDSSEAFVRPAATFVTYLTGKRRERAAMHGIEEVLDEILLAREHAHGQRGDFLDQIRASFDDLEPAEARRQTARDVTLIHMGSQSNLYAALAWTLVNLLRHPELIERVRAGDDELLEQCASESIRMAQRSITLRQVLRPVTVELETGAHVIEPGVMITTMLSVNNTSAAPGLERFEPSHYEGRRLAPHVHVATRELVSTFGHGVHSCPAQRFAITAIRIAIRRLLERYDLRGDLTGADPRRRQIGGVARAERPCHVTYAALGRAASS